MLNICLCDDDTKTLNNYSNKITKLLNKNMYIFQIETFKSGENLIFELECNPNRFNIIIIDIIMKNINGIDATKILRKYGYKGIIIFLTSSKEYALDSFKVNPLNYILKNENNDRFEKILLKAADEIDKEHGKSILISSKSKNKILNIHSVVYMESLNKKVVLHDIFGNKEEINGVFKELYEKVKEYGFIRCHKSYIVNIKYIQTFNSLECKLQREITIPIGRKYLKDFRIKILEAEVEHIMI